MVTKVRQRVAQETKGHRGRKDDLAWAHRMLLLRAGDKLSERAVHRLDGVFAHDDPTGEIGAAWGVKERLRMLLACTDLDTADTARGLLGITVVAADLPRLGDCGRPSTTGGTRSRPSSKPGSPTPVPRPRTPRSGTSSAPDAATATTGTTRPVSCYAATGRHAGGAHA
jgi:hypothetical protein